MLGGALVFAIIAVVAGWLGFMVLSSLAAVFAKVLFFVFLALLVLTFVIRAVKGRSVI